MQNSAGRVGRYDVDDVLVTIDGRIISKGDGATGVFVVIGGGPYWHATRHADGGVTRSAMHDPWDIKIVLSDSSPDIGVLRAMGGTPAVVRIHRRDNGEQLLQGEGMADEERSPHGDLSWRLTVSSSGQDP